mgnify:CR=1 FL=1
MKPESWSGSDSEKKYPDPPTIPGSGFWLLWIRIGNTGFLINIIWDWLQSEIHGLRFPRPWLRIRFQFCKILDPEPGLGRFGYGFGLNTRIQIFKCPNPALIESRIRIRSILARIRKLAVLQLSAITKLKYNITYTDCPNKILFYIDTGKPQKKFLR